MGRTGCCGRSWSSKYCNDICMTLRVVVPEAESAFDIIEVTNMFIEVTNKLCQPRLI
jgi:hypothetical protein